MSTQHEPEDAFESIRRLKELRQLIDNAIQQMSVGAMKHDPDGCDRLLKARGVEGYDWLLGDYAIKKIGAMDRFKPAEGFTLSELLLGMGDPKK